MATLRDAALRYAKAGLAVLPCNGKKPLLPGHGYLDATADPDVIEQWWDEHPNANIGIAPGTAGLLVVDVDVKGEVDGHDSLDILEAEHGKLPETRTTATPSGGVHFYFRVPSDETFGNRKRAEGIDIRCSKGYVLAPPSAIRGNSYRWTNSLRAEPLPAAWVELLRDKPYVPPSGGDRPGAPTDGCVPSGRESRAKYLKAAYDDELEILLHANDGDGNDQVNKFGFSLGQLVSAGIREDNIRAGAEWVFSQWQWRKARDLVAARRTLESGIRAGEANPRGGI
jgi:hypothetical protein